MKHLNKLLNFTLMIIILLSSTTGLWASASNIDSKFKDIKPNDWYFNSVKNLTDKGIINGYNDNTFKPHSEVLTSEFLKLAFETAGIKIDYNTSPWHKDLMQKALDHKIIDKTLYNSPDSPIKRREVAVVLAKLIENTPNLKSEFINERSKEYDRFKYLVYDTTTLSEEYRNSIYKLFEYGLIIGTTNKKDQVFYNPEDNLTRAEVATIIERLIEPSKKLDKYAEYPNRNNIFTKYHTGPLQYNDEDGRPDVTLFSDLVSTYNINPDIENERFLFNYQERKYEVGKEEVEPASIVDGKEYFYFDDIWETIENVPMSEELNPNINKQVYELTKATIDKNYYVYIGGFDYKSEDNKVHCSIAKSELFSINSNDYWHFILQEKKPYNVKEDMQIFPNSDLSENSIITLRLDRIWEEPTEGWVDWFYADKLRISFIALFGEKDGHEIYEYVLDEYVKYRLAGSNESTGYNYIYKTKDIGNIHIDLITGDSAILYFHFSYKN